MSPTRSGLIFKPYWRLLQHQMNMGAETTTTTTTTDDDDNQEQDVIMEDAVDEENQNTTAAPSGDDSSSSPSAKEKNSKKRKRHKKKKQHPSGGEAETEDDDEEVASAEVHPPKKKRRQMPAAVVSPPTTTTAITPAGSHRVSLEEESTPPPPPPPLTSPTFKTPARPSSLRDPPPSLMATAETKGVVPSPPVVMKPIAEEEPNLVWSPAPTSPQLYVGSAPPEDVLLQTPTAAAEKGHSILEQQQQQQGTSSTVQPTEADVQVAKKYHDSTSSIWRHLHTLMVAICWSYVVGILGWGYIYHHHSKYQHQASDALSTTSVSSIASKCYRNNVRSTVKYQGYCGAGTDPTTFEACPQNALCFGGSVYDCSLGGKSMELGSDAPYYYQWNSRHEKCEWIPQVQMDYTEVVKIVHQWTLAQACGATASKGNLVWKDNQERPMFLLTDVTQHLNTTIFNVHHPVDAFTFTNMVNDVKGSLVLAPMPDLAPPSGRRRGWFSPPQANQQYLASTPNIPKGTPLVGYATRIPSSMHYYPQLEEWWLSAQCWWYGMSSSPSSKENNGTPSTTTTATPPVEGQDAVGTKTAAASEDEATSSKVKDAVNENVKPTATAERAYDNDGKSIADENGQDRSEFAEGDDNQKSKKRFLFPWKGRGGNENKHEIGMEGKGEKLMTNTPTKSDNTEAEASTAPTCNPSESALFPTPGSLVGGAVCDIGQSSDEINATTGNEPDEANLLSSFYGNYKMHYLYPFASVVGLIVVLVLRHQQSQRRMRPEIAYLKAMALERIAEATNGGWIVTHLRDAVLSSATAGSSERRRQYLERTIWPHVEEELRRDDWVTCSTVESKTTGKVQPVFSWRKPTAVDHQ